jgi:hypothetical protein
MPNVRRPTGRMAPRHAIHTPSPHSAAESALTRSRTLLLCPLFLELPSTSFFAHRSHAQQHRDSSSSRHRLTPL